MKGRRKIKRQTNLMRYGAVKNWRANIGVHVEKSRGHLPERACGSWLELSGDFSEPVVGVSAFTVLAHPNPEVSLGSTEPPCIGVFIEAKPVMQAVVAFSDGEFDRLLALAVSNQIRSIFFSFTPPHWRRAEIVNIDFSTRTVEEAEANDQ